MSAGDSVISLLHCLQHDLANAVVNPSPVQDPLDRFGEIHRRVPQLFQLLDQLAGLDARRQLIIVTYFDELVLGAVQKATLDQPTSVDQPNERSPFPLVASPSQE